MFPRLAASATLTELETEGRALATSLGDVRRASALPMPTAPSMPSHLAALAQKKSKPGTV